MTAKRTAEQLADVLFPEINEQEDFADGVLSIPPEQRKLHTETYDFTVETIVEKMGDGSIFVPKFQRRYVWSDAQASRLIESLIIQCPIPGRSQGPSATHEIECCHENLHAFNH